MKQRRPPFGPAWLIHGGLRRATLHVFNHSELKTIKRFGATVVGLAHMYRCTETDQLRQWGFDRTYAHDNGAN